MPSDLIYPDKIGKTYPFKHNADYGWFYFPRVQRNEAILLKCYDSKDDGRACFTAHTSLEDPASDRDAAARESIEVGALIFWLEQDRS